MLPVKRLLLAAVLVAIFVIGSMKHPLQHTHQGVNQAPQAPVVVTAPRVTVEIRSFDFFPRELTVRTGAAVTWVNRDAAPHDATEQAGGWGSGLLKQDESITIVFDSPGVYQYHCTIHPNMQATLKVSDRLAGARKAASPARAQIPTLSGTWRFGNGRDVPPGALADPLAVRPASPTGSHRRARVAA